MKPFTVTVPGYPRVGVGRVYKKLLEDLWKGTLSEPEFLKSAAELRGERLRTQVACGVELAPVGDFALYDHVLDAAVSLGCIPSRFGWLGDAVGPKTYFAMARGRDGAAPLEMTKWFDTNYHYLVPELPKRFSRVGEGPRAAFREARAALGPDARLKFVLVGPFTFLKLARLSGAELARRLEELTPIYAEFLAELAADGAELVQLDEPSLVGDVSPEEAAACEKCYRALGAGGAPILLQTYYGDVAAQWPWLRTLPVAGWGLDFVRGRQGNLAALAAQPVPAGKILVAGVVDGRNLWRTDLDDAFDLAYLLFKSQNLAPEQLLVGASCSLLHLPETTSSEKALPTAVKDGVCFAQERLAELSLLAAALRNGKDSVSAAWNEHQSRRAAWLAAPGRLVPAVRERMKSLTEDDFQRLPYAQRKELQQTHLNLPLLPTTTIGSFPQTTELRQARAQSAANPAAYQRAIDAEIEKVIRLQEEVGLDVLVHGEPERNDMVQFFGDQLTGFATTKEGWVQSYGSRCVRPPVVYGDVVRTGPMTVRETKLAQSLTDRPVKGMLTGPITILQWSFVREDQPRSETAYQIALAIRDEAVDLEREAGVSVVQIDEPAFREGLPLRRADWDAYLGDAVRAFRLATAGVSPRTQVHTHMCYSEFGDVIDSIAALDADVISIEDARSDGAMLQTLRDYRYPAQIGPGVYDIHSPNIPSVDDLAGRLRAVLSRLPAEQVWANPDCGLKTRGYAEVEASLRNLVEAARKVREEAAALV